MRRACVLQSRFSNGEGDGAQRAIGHAGAGVDDRLGVEQERQEQACGARQQYLPDRARRHTVAYPRRAFRLEYRQPASPVLVLKAIVDERRDALATNDGTDDHQDNGQGHTLRNWAEASEEETHA